MFQPKFAVTLLAVNFLAVIGFADNLSADTHVKHADLKLIPPEQPAETVVDLGGGLLQHRLIINRPNGSIIVWHQESEAGVTDREAVLQKAKSTVVQIAKGEVSLEMDLDLQGNPGMMFTVALPVKNGEYRVAYLYANGKNYQVMSVGTKDFTRSAELDKMFASMKFETDTK